MNDVKIAVIGLGYVGLPLARLFATKYPVIGYDINEGRVSEISRGIDSTLEIDSEELVEVLVKGRTNSIGLFCTTLVDEIKECNFYIVTVPTPIDKYNHPDLRPLVKASEVVGSVLKKGDVVVYESTVYPGATEEDCVPVLERISGLRYNLDFFVGYSPERINPGDKEHTVEKILKVTSGSNADSAKRVDDLYSSVITAGTFRASSIKVAEAAKVIENAQRDVNIAFVNELAKIFNLMNINTHDVLEAASTKWNFLQFKPGLVGGHCIGVDPYYLSQKAQELGYNPEVILAGRRMNDSMGSYVASEVVKLMIRKGVSMIASRILILGITFKENCPDIRNSKVIDIYNKLIDYKITVDVYDSWANPKEVSREYGFDLIEDIKSGYNAVILAVGHDVFKNLSIEKIMDSNAILYDVKGFFDSVKVDGNL